MWFSRRIFFLVLLLVLSTAVLVLEIYFVLPQKTVLPHETLKNIQAVISLPPPPPQKLSNPPEIIKAVYMTGYSAGSKTYLKYLANLFKNTEINAVVVDIKGSDGYVTYDSASPDVKKYNLSDKVIGDIDEFVRFCHDQNVYVIGRIAVFEDPKYSKARPELAIYNKAETTHSTSSGQADLSKPALWRDNNNLSWLDPASKDVWDYEVSLAKDAFYNGFDEINFDYVRFPSDGKTENMGFPVWDGKASKADVIKSFFEYLRSNLNGKISVDLFGQTTVNTDDMGIGQIIENAFENFDYVSPMVYPSHYINGFIGFANPAEHPYEVVKYSMNKAISREKTFFQAKADLAAKNSAVTTLSEVAIKPVLLAKLRPWLQNFNMGAFYTADMVKQEIKATQDSLGSDFSGFMLWNPSNIYTQEAVLKSK